MCSKCHWTILSQRSCVRGERREIVCAEGSSRHSALSNSKKRTAINTKSWHRPAPRSVASHEDGLISSFGNRNGKGGVSSSPVSAKVTHTNANQEQAHCGTGGKVPICKILHMTRRTRFIRLRLWRGWCQSVSRNFGKK